MADQEFKNAVETSRGIELTVTGRTSGREISNPVWFVRDGEKRSSGVTRFSIDPV